MYYVLYSVVKAGSCSSVSAELASERVDSRPSRTSQKDGRQWVVDQMHTLSWSETTAQSTVRALSVPHLLPNDARFALSLHGL